MVSNSTYSEKWRIWLGKHSSETYFNFFTKVIELLAILDFVIKNSKNFQAVGQQKARNLLLFSLFWQKMFLSIWIAWRYSWQLTFWCLSCWLPRRQSSLALELNWQVVVWSEWVICLRWVQCGRIFCLLAFLVRWFLIIIHLNIWLNSKKTLYFKIESLLKMNKNAVVAF